jgi:hypothetical protein
MQSRIDQFYPGTKLAIGEYWYGRGGDISSTITNADFLGIMARHGVYGATMWPNASNVYAYNVPNNCNADGACITNHAYQCAMRAIDVFRNYDGAGGQFGDTYVSTSIKDPSFTIPASQAERVTSYSSMDAGNPNRMVVVAINKSLTAAINAAIQVTHTALFKRATPYRVTGTNGAAGGCSLPVRQSDIAIDLPNAFNATLAPQSVSILVLTP